MIFIRIIQMLIESEKILFQDNLVFKWNFWDICFTLLTADQQKNTSFLFPSSPICCVYSNSMIVTCKNVYIIIVFFPQILPFFFSFNTSCVKRWRIYFIFLLSISYFHHDNHCFNQTEVVWIFLSLSVCFMRMSKCILYAVAKKNNR